VVADYQLSADFFAEGRFWRGSCSIETVFVVDDQL